MGNGANKGNKGKRVNKGNRENKRSYRNKGKKIQLILYKQSLLGGYWE